MKTPRDKDAELHYKWLFFPRWIKLFVEQFLYCMQSANSVLNSVSQERPWVHQEKVFNFKKSYSQKLLFTWTSTSVSSTFSTFAEIMEFSLQIDNSGLQTAPSCGTTLSYRSAINRAQNFLKWSTKIQTSLPRANISPTVIISSSSSRHLSLPWGLW